MRFPLARSPILAAVPFALLIAPALRSSARPTPIAPAALVQAADPVKSALEHPILREGEALAELRDYCDNRVLRMPQVSSAREWRRCADRMRADTLRQVIFRGEAARWRDGKTRVEWLDTLEGGPGYRIRKLRYQAVPGLWIPALLYEPEKLSGRAPVVLNVNGHDRKGKSADYKQIRCINQAKRGMLALNVEWFGMGQFATPAYSHDLINAIDLCGASGIAAHYLMLKRGIDVLLSLEHADPKRVAVTGLSGGGWQTIFISSLDTRVALTDPVAGYSSFRTRARYDSDLGDSEQTPCDLGTTTDYAHMTAMMAPRAALLTFNAKDDCCFRADHALQPLLDAAGPIFNLFGKESSLRSHVNEDPGTHNYLLDNRQALYRMLGDTFFPGRSDYDPKEIPSDAEVKSADALQVPLPANNASLSSLAKKLASSLPRDPALPGEREPAERWRNARRKRLREVVRARDYTVKAESNASDTEGDVRSTYWKLRISDARDGLTVPLVEITRGTPRETVVLIGDAGRKSLADAARAHLDAGRRVLAVDPFYLGESNPDARRGYLWALFVAAIGDRPVGLQASQLAAIARWAESDRRWGKVRVAAVGPRAGLAALAAAGLEKDAISRLDLTGSLSSLKEAIERPIPYGQAPELYCFGLLEAFDIKQLAALAAPRPVVFHEASSRAEALPESVAAGSDCSGCPKGEQRRSPS